MLRHIELWEKWCRSSNRNWFYKILVLFGVVCPDDFMLTLTDSEVVAIKSSLACTDAK